MAGRARRIGRGQIVVVVLVAVFAGARRRGMAAGQNKARYRVIEVGIDPTVGVMTALAGLAGKEGSAGVLGVGGAIEIFLVAADALGGHEVEIGESTILMTIFAGRSGMSAGEREAIHVHVDLSNGDFPAAHGMTVFASAGHFAAVDVGVAVGALAADVGEDHLGVTVHAVDVFVQAAQRKLGLVVVELGNRSDGLPPVHGVTVLTGDIQIAVGAARLLRSLRRLCPRNGRRQQQPQDHPFCDQTKHQSAPPQPSRFWKPRVRAL